MQITFDSVSLVSSPYTIRRFTSDDVQNRQMFVYGLARQRGASLLNSELKEKTFKMEGTITGTSLANLEANVDTFKELVSRSNKNLDIEYAGGTRRFVATASKINIPRDFFNITFVPFEVEFLCSAGVGTDITTTSVAVTGITTLIRTTSVSVLGTISPPMKTTIDITAATAITKVELLVNGDKLTLTTSITAGMQIIFDEGVLKVTKDGAEVDYTGIFPKFDIGSNSYTLTFTGTSLTYNLTFTYTKNYL